MKTISSDNYHFSDHPERVEAARAGLRVVETLACGLILTPHPNASNPFKRLSGKEPLVGLRACFASAAVGSDRLAKRLDTEKTAR